MRLRTRLRRWPVRGWAAIVVSVVLAGCTLADGSGPVPAERPDPGVVRIASFDFPENQVLAELYAQQLRRAGLRVTVLAGLGTREVVAPALEQGLVDLVVEYTGTLLDYLGGTTGQTHGTPLAVHAALQDRLSTRGLTALRPAAAEDTNAFAVRTSVARQRQLVRLSDLRGIAGQLTFGGPSECPTRRYCLRGLQDTYGLRFAGFRSQPTRAATATALESGEIDVGLLETTDGSLADGRLTVLADDRGLQPRDNIVPVVRTAVLGQYGERLSGPLDTVTAALTTAGLIGLSRTLAISPAPPADVAAAYLATLVR
jgi:osmoprotectant transport system substrate-binding protein